MATVTKDISPPAGEVSGGTITVTSSDTDGGATTATVALTGAPVVTREGLRQWAMKMTREVGGGAG